MRGSGSAVPKLASRYGFLLGMIDGYQDYWDGNAEEITGINVVDDYTLEVTMAESFAEFDYIVAFNDTAPIPEEEVEGKEEAFALMPIGNGPFKMTEPWAAGQYIKTGEFAGLQHVAKPLVDGIEFKIYTDLNTAWTDFEAGAVDSDQIPPGNYVSVAATYGLSVDGDTANPGAAYRTARSSSVSRSCSIRRPVMAKQGFLRMACSLAINRQVSAIWCGKALVYLQIAYPSGYRWLRIWSLRCTASTTSKRRRPPWSEQGTRTAKVFLLLKLCFIAGAGQDETMQLVKSDLAAIGINVVFDTTDGPTYWAEAGERPVSDRS